MNGPWDVDNDGDGIAESVWIDIGLPVQTYADGRRFKPLVAILCTDLDGRLNVNAHGTAAQASPGYDTFATQVPTGSIRISNYVFSSTGTPTPLSLPRGSGYGPAEINLGIGGIFGGGASYANFMTGTATPTGVAYEGRYGNYGSMLSQIRPGVRSVPASAPTTDWRRSSTMT